jgi:hypothetical protein
MQKHAPTFIHLPFNKYPLYDPSNRRGKKKKDKEENMIVVVVSKKAVERVGMGEQRLAY